MACRRGLGGLKRQGWLLRWRGRRAWGCYRILA